MQTSESTKEIAQALAKAQAEFKPVAKSGRNHEFRYTYADLDDYFAVVRPVLGKYGLSLTSSVVEAEPLPERKTFKGTVMYGVRVKVTTRLLHTSGEWIEATAYGEGLDTGDKAAYKATTGARKYALASILGLATSDDPERDEAPAQAVPESDRLPVRAPSPEERLASEAQRKRLAELARDPKLSLAQRRAAEDALERERLTRQAADGFIRRAEEVLRGGQAA